MAFYPQYPPMYSYHYMPYAGQDFYPVHPEQAMDTKGHHYITGSSPPMHHHHHHRHHGLHHVKPGYNNRKISADSGISDRSGRKMSNTSTISNTSMILEEPHLEEVKEEMPFEEPDKELCEKIVQQVEFYFSDPNISKDKFLLKHVKRNKEGFVSLKLISSFKRVKHLTKDWRQVAHAIEQHSEKLQVNDLKTKVRRLEALPEYDETTPSRTVVAHDLPLERPTIEAVAEIFAKCGDISLVRILRPGNPVPADVKPFVNKHPELADKVCALIEYEQTEFAKKAVKELTDDKMTVLELTLPAAKPAKKEQKKSEFRRFSQASLLPAPSALNPEAPRRRISLMHNMKFSPIVENLDQQQQKAGFTLNPDAPSFQMHHVRRPSLAYIPVPVDMHQAVMPWMMRRMPVMPQPEGFKTEKTRGFQKWCKNRMIESKKPASKAVPIVPPPEKQPEEDGVVDVSEDEAQQDQHVVEAFAADSEKSR